MNQKDTVALPAEVVALLRGPALCYLSTVMPDGSPQLTQTWVDTDGEHVVINTVEGHQKLRNTRREPRVTVAVSSAAQPSRYIEIRGVVVETTTTGADEHIELLAQRYLGGPYPRYGGPGEQRVIVRIAPTKLNTMG